MSKYVDVEELLNRLPDDLPYKASVKRVLIQAPTADVVEVRHGYWKWEKKIEPMAQNRLYCSCCDKECLGKNNYYELSKYCPHCGAKMDGERREL